ESDVDRTIAELCVEPADDEAARTRQLKLDARPSRALRRRDDDPGARDADADLKSPAFVRRARRPGADGGDRATQCEHDQRASHGTLRNQAADSAPPTRSSAAEPPANRSVTSRDCRRWPRREASRL